MLFWGRAPSNLGALKLGIGFWEFGALWKILLGFKVIIDFVKFLNSHLSKLVFVNKCEIGGNEGWEFKNLTYCC
jgi:hypothetical protein